jgi:hypothetical protein
VPLELADDGGRGVGRELDLPVGIEAVDGLDQADGGDLDQVVQRFTPAGEPAGQVLDQPQVPFDQPFPNGRVAFLLELTEQLLDLWFGQWRMPVVAAQADSPRSTAKCTTTP